MKKSLIALATLGALSAMTSMAHAADNITVYGVIDESIRTSSHAAADGGRLNEVRDGVLSGSRIGFKGGEDLGNGLKAIFRLEAGFNSNNGGFNNGTQTGQQDNRLFGRQAYVGLSDDKYGTLTVGRQNNLAYDLAQETDVYSVSNNIALGGYQGFLTGYRWDNSLKYTNNFNGFKLGLQGASGNTAGSNSTNSGYAISGGYQFGKLDIQAAYQRANDTNNGVPGTLAGQRQKLAVVGASYDFGVAKVYGQYFNNKFDVTNQKNNIYVLGASYNLAPKVTLNGSVTYDQQKNFNAGHRNTYTALVNYSLSKRTDVYAEVDYNKFGGQYSNAAYNLNTSANPNTNSTGVGVGVRHAF